MPEAPCSASVRMLELGRRQQLPPACGNPTALCNRCLNAVCTRTHMCLCLQAQGLIRRGAKLTDKQQKQERICVRFYGALVLSGGGAASLSSCTSPRYDDSARWTDVAHTHHKALEHATRRGF
jgi:hypothetical protein